MTGPEAELARLTKLVMYLDRKLDNVAERTCDLETEVFGEAQAETVDRFTAELDATDDIAGLVDPE